MPASRTATPAMMLDTAERRCHIVMTGYDNAMLFVDSHGYLVSMSTDGSVLRSEVRPGLAELLHLRAAGRIPQRVVETFGYRLLDLTVTNLTTRSRQRRIDRDGNVGAPCSKQTAGPGPMASGL